MKRFVLLDAIVVLAYIYLYFIPGMAGLILLAFSSVVAGIYVGMRLPGSIIEDDMSVLDHDSSLLHLHPEIRVKMRQIMLNKYGLYLHKYGLSLLFLCAILFVLIWSQAISMQTSKFIAGLLTIWSVATSVRCVRYFLNAARKVK